MKKLAVLVLFLCLFTLGCQQTVPVDNSITEAVMTATETGTIEETTLDPEETTVGAPYTRHRITFPISDYGKTEYNAVIYENPPFEVTFDLPEGWTIKESRTDEGTPPFSPLLAVWSMANIYDGDGNCVGCVGYNTYNLNEGVEDNPQAIYSQIDLGSVYWFDISDTYKLVTDTPSTCTAMTWVRYDELMKEDMGAAPVQKTNRGIVSHNLEKLVYIAMEIEITAIDDTQQQAIAKSIAY